MPKYNHPQSKMNWFFKKFENNEHSHALKVIARLTGVLTMIVSAFFTENMEFLLAFFAGGILAMDLVFFCLGKRDSHYKTAVFFQDIQATPESMDKYNKILLIVKSLSFVLVILAPALIHYYGFLCLIIAPIVGNQVNFGNWIGDKTNNTSSFEDRYGYNSSQSSSTNMTYGVHGYSPHSGAYIGDSSIF